MLLAVAGLPSLCGSVTAIEAANSISSQNSPTVAAEGPSSRQSLPSMTGGLVRAASSAASSKEMESAVSSAVAVGTMYENPPWKPPAVVDDAG